jgi:peptidoglycan/xylan/chitin deacetylase (PgdA/CDA1 family)
MRILDILKRNDAKATFFQLGKNIQQYPNLTEAVMQAGHEIGNHSYNHHGMAFMSTADVAKEIEDTDKLLRNNGYQSQILFRPPYGDKLFSLPHYLKNNNRTTVMWNINPDDHPAGSLNPDIIVTTVLAHIEPGSIIVMHPEYKDRIASLNAIEPIIVTLKKLGYEFVTVSELLQYQ